MRWQDIFKSKKDEPKEERVPTPFDKSRVDRANRLMMVIVQSGTHKRLLNSLFTDMNELTDLIPLIQGESEKHREERKISAISLAINDFHERYDPAYLINNHDMEEVFYVIKHTLQCMDKDKDNCHRQAQIINSAADSALARAAQ